jgi:hypothetical protein
MGQQGRASRHGQIVIRYGEVVNIYRLSYVGTTLLAVQAQPTTGGWSFASVKEPRAPDLAGEPDMPLGLINSL